MNRRIRYLVAVNQLVLLISVDMIFVSIVIFMVFLCPASIQIFLAKFGFSNFFFPLWWYFTCLDLCIFFTPVALPWDFDKSGIYHLTRFCNIALQSQLLMKTFK